MRGAPSPDMSIEQAMAKLNRFDEMLRAGSSATAILEKWIASRTGGAIALRAHIVREPVSIVPADITSRLGVKDPALIAYRRVRLAHGGRVYSDARNWYVPSRLPDNMRAILADGATPFGRIIEQLKPMRRMLAAERLWTAGSEDTVARTIPPRLLRHQALILSADGEPICEVDEVYTRNILI
jgi:chorismate-pyruvate lyase